MPDSAPNQVPTSAPAARATDRRRRRPVWIAVALVALLAAVAAVTPWLLEHGDADPTGARTDRPGPVAPLSAVQVRQGPPPPAHGAYFGAAAQRSDYSEQGRIDAVTALERGLGRRLAVVHTYHPWTDPFPSESDRWFAAHGRLLLLSWAGSDTRSIAAGHDDALIRARAVAVKALGVPVLLEWRWEMDRPNLQAEIWSPEDYRAAWGHIQDIFASAGVRNVGWVWCPTAEGFASGRAAAYYPGDDRVDWLCADGYPTSGWPSLQSLLHPFLTWASHHPRPVIIGEFGALDGGGRRAAWLADAAADLASDGQVKAVVYFDIDSVNHGQILSWSLDWSPTSMAAFRRFGTDPHFAPLPPTA